MKLAEYAPKLTPLLERPVAILGYGVSGHAVASLLSEFQVEWIVYDEKEGEGITRDFKSYQAKEHKLAVFSPGFRPDHPWLETARECGLSLMGELELASHFWKGEVIAVTGTNGKTTLTEFLSFAHKRHGKDAVAVGNNGVPLSRLAASPQYDGVVAVCEVSSFQAESLDSFRADALLWTNFSEDHLDRYGDMEAYFLSKWRLVERLRQPVFFYGPSVAEAAKSFGVGIPDYARLSVADTGLLGSISLDSAFNTKRQVDNLALARDYWLSKGYPLNVLLAAADNFKTLEHRLKAVSMVSGITFWNDSKSTNFGAALGALENFDGPVLWIGGGKSRRGDIRGFARKVKPHVRIAYLLGETAPIIKQVLEEDGVQCRIFKSLPEATEAAFEDAREGEHVLFSPGFSSQDNFTDYIERGTHFENAVLRLKNQNVALASDEETQEEK